MTFIPCDISSAAERLLARALGAPLLPLQPQPVSVLIAATQLNEPKLTCVPQTQVKFAT